MQKEFVPYPLALRMKALGYDELCFGWYEHNGNFYYCYQEGIVPPSPSKKLIKGSCLAPTYQQAFRWFREKHDWTIKVNQATKTNWSYTLKNFPNERTFYGKLYETFEEAEIACLTKLIEIVENQ